MSARSQPPTNVLVYLVGFPGVGKLTVARELAPLLNARVVDNHAIANPVLSLLDTDRLTPFTPEAWVRVAAVRAVILDTIATLSAPAANFVLTHAGLEGDDEDRRIYEAVLHTAIERDALFVPVRLICDEAALVARVVAPDRAERLKSMDPVAAARDHRARETLRTVHINETTLDVSALSPRTAAARIFATIEALAAGRDPLSLRAPEGDQI